MQFLLYSFIAAASLGSANPLLQKRNEHKQQCNADNCARAVTGTNVQKPPIETRRAQCRAFMQGRPDAGASPAETVTVTPTVTVSRDVDTATVSDAITTDYELVTDTVFEPIPVVTSTDSFTTPDITTGAAMTMPTGAPIPVSPDASTMSYVVTNVTTGVVMTIETFPPIPLVTPSPVVTARNLPKHSPSHHSKEHHGEHHRSSGGYHPHKSSAKASDLMNSTSAGVTSSALKSSSSSSSTFAPTTTAAATMSDSGVDAQGVPFFATACSGTARYASACSCWGFTAATPGPAANQTTYTVTADAQTVTVPMTAFVTDDYAVTSTSVVTAFAPYPS